jgi:hypothetical protein
MGRAIMWRSDVFENPATRCSKHEATISHTVLHHHGFFAYNSRWRDRKSVRTGVPYRLSVRFFLRKEASRKQLARQADHRIQSQRLLIHHQTACFHPLDFLREDGRELEPKNLHQLHDRYLHSATQFGYN